MKTKTIITRKVFLIFFTIASLSFFGCSSEDDEAIPNEPTEITFQVDLVKMYATDIKDGEGGRLEVAGGINAKIRSNTDITQVSETLWFSYTNNPLYVTYDDVILGSRAFITVSSDYNDYSYFVMVGSMTEVDVSAGNPNEDMGDVNVITDLMTITDTQEFVLEFKESEGQYVEVVYTITRL